MTFPTSRYALESLNPDGFLALRREPSPRFAAGAFLCEYTNPAAEVLLRGALPGRHLLAVCPGLSEAVPAWAQVLDTGLPHTCVLALGPDAGGRRLKARAARVEGDLLAVWLTDVTEDERFVRETALFEERMLAFVECMPDPFLALEGEGRLVYVNGSAERLLGKPRQALIGRPLAQVYAGEHGSQLHAQVGHVKDTGLPVDFTEPCAGRDFRATVVPLWPGALIYLRDTAAPLESVLAERGFGALFQAVLQGSSDAIYTKDLEGRYTRINEAGARLMGRSPESVLGHTDEELWPEEAARATRAHDHEVLTFRQTLTYEEEDTRPTPRVWRSTKGVLRDERGGVSGLYGISRDMTDLKRRDEALSAASMTLWDLRLPERRLAWEREAAAFFSLDALPAEEPLDAFLARVHGEDRAAVAQALSLEALSSSGVSVIYRVRGPNGAPRRHVLRARVSALGAGWRVLGLLEDITGPRRENEVRARPERGFI